LLKNAIEDKEHGFGERKADYKDGDLRLIADMADGDARLAIDALGFILDNAPANKSGKVKLSKKLIDEAFQKKSIYYDKEEDRYNLLSALQKSVRGSDPDAALHYLARLIEGGADLLMVSRRLLVMAAEDVGIAYPTAVAITHAAVESARLTGFPEARIQLAFATVLLASLPKTNRAYVAYEKAASDLKSKDVPDIPDFLKDSHYSGSKKLGRGFGYLNPHDTNGQPKQRYLPQEMLDAGTRYYFPRDIGLEKNFKKYLEELWK
jgi:putative ATPase